MLFALVARFRADAEPGREAMHEAFNAHIAQGVPSIRLAGSLRGPEGARTGVLMLVEAKDLDQARRFVDSSPYAAAGLYERTDIDLLDIEAGSLG